VTNKGSASSGEPPLSAEELRTFLDASRTAEAQEVSEIEMPEGLPSNIYDPGWLRLAASGWGAGLEAIWHTTWRTLGVTMALIADTEPAATYQRIPYKRSLAKRDIVDVLFGIFEQPDIELKMMNVLVALGPKSGHAIGLIEIDANSNEIVYQDPETLRDPGARSLLCEGNNSLGLAAKPAQSRPGAWTITRDELETAIVAAYVKPAGYATMMGVAYKLSLESVLADDFGQFFGLRLEGPELVIGKNQTVQARLGSHESEIRLQFELQATNDIQRATFTVDRTMLEGPNRPLALDALKSFIPAVTPLPDRPEVEFLSEAISRTGQGVEGAETSLGEGPPHLVVQVREVWECLAGRKKAGYFWLPLSTIATANLDDGRGWWFSVAVALSELRGGYMFGVEEPTLVGSNN